MPPSGDRLGPIVPPPLWYAAGLVVGWLLCRRFPVSILPDAGRWTVGPLCVIIGVAFVAPAVASFVRAKTSVMPVRPTTALVETGPYRFTRNPMYVGFAFVYVGIALLANWLWAIAILPIVLIAVYATAIVPEERFLERTFGQDYAAYRSRVHRWL
jgi:protein-S-isoprenylcysteine O-methyltransferase Ste14